MMFFGLATVGITGTRTRLRPSRQVIDHLSEQALGTFVGQ